MIANTLTFWMMIIVFCSSEFDYKALSILLQFILVILNINLYFMYFLPQHLPNMIVHITTYGSRIFVSDVQESVHFVRYKRAENQLVVFADETNPRWVTTSCVLDFDTVAVADKFGNIGVVRIFKL